MGRTERPWIHQSGYLESEDEVMLFWQGIVPRDGHRASVAMVHGFNSSSNFMLPMMKHLAEQGLACYAIDNRGHGRSQGVRRHIFRFGEYLSDLRTLCDHVSHRAGTGDVFLFGNSLGGLIVSMYGLIHPDQLRGTALTAPFFGPAFQVPRLLDACARVASVVCPTWCLPRRHELQPKIVTLRWWTETTAAQQALQREADRFRVPLLLLHGQKDTVACPQAARNLFERLGSEDKTFRLLPGLRHCDLDPCRGPQWWSEVRDWMVRRTESGSNSARA